MFHFSLLSYSCYIRKLKNALRVLISSSFINKMNLLEADVGLASGTRVKSPSGLRRRKQNDGSRPTCAVRGRSVAYTTGYATTTSRLDPYCIARSPPLNHIQSRRELIVNKWYEDATRSRCKGVLASRLEKKFKHSYRRKGESICTAVRRARYTYARKHLRTRRLYHACTPYVPIRRPVLAVT